MSSNLPIGDMVVALQRRRFPTITTWNRCEARPRTTSFDRALKAEVRDALWMLTKQWQMGEFRGSDAGSPVFVKTQLQTTRLTKYSANGGATEAFSHDLPFEAKVEQRPLPFEMNGRLMLLDIRLVMGRQWLKLIKSLDPGYRQAFIDAYGVAVPDPSSAADLYICAHPEAWQSVAAIAGRVMDGGALYLHLKSSPSNHAYDGMAGVSVGDRGVIDDLAKRFLAWASRLIIQPPSADGSAWDPPQLEYKFSASAPLPGGVEKVYVAEEYYQGRLDWYSVDVDARVQALKGPELPTDTGLPPDAPQTMIPIPVSFAGMPNTRWWAFEDSKTNYGDINAATTDLAKLLFMEFALVYANDWFIIPYTLPAGLIATVRGMVVTNVFGERLWIEAADRGADADWRRWSMFTVNVQSADNAPADPSLLLLPTVAKIQESASTEATLLLRDEVANMVWGVETLVPLATGDTKRGIEAARQTIDFLTTRLGAAPSPAPPAAASIRYTVMHQPPENWIPFIPVHVPNNNREIQIQRAALPRVVQGNKPIQPRTVLLREGLDQSKTYFIFEEEVPRAGTRMTQCFERTRWKDGRVYTWLRVRRSTGRGEGFSGLAFDQIDDVPFKPPSK